MLRNPADATYSYFKMKMRRSDDPVHRMYFKKYRKYTPEMFKEYLDDDIFSGKDQRFSYDIWLKEYLKYFPRESIKIIIFEEIIREPERILTEIQEFILAYATSQTQACLHLATARGSNTPPLGADMLKRS